jgi:two-component system, sensor histidine kinase RegB
LSHSSATLSSDSHLSGHPTLFTAVWLVQLRWVAVVGQWLAVGITHWGLGIDLPLVPLIGLIAVTASSNLLCTYLISIARKRISAASHPDDRAKIDHLSISGNWLGAIILLDVITLAGLLYFTGGIANPFSCFFLANIVIGGLVLSPPWTWSLAALTFVCTIWLLMFAPPLEKLGINFDPGLSFFTVPKQGILIAIGTCCAVIAYFITVLVRELRRSEGLLIEAEQQRESAQRVEALATLAAGAGHELASPLSTIAVVAKEMSRKLERTEGESWIRRDVDLIRSELDRCREILQRMKSGAGEAAAEVMHLVKATELVENILTPMRQPDRVETVIEPAVRQEAIRLPLQAVSQAIRNLVQNAMDASEANAKVAMHFESREDSWIIIIIDRGTGMTEETLRRIGQPFYTTKEVGQGMGLGVFLTRNVLSGLGSKLEFESQWGRGTTCQVTIPKNRPGN